MNLHRGGTSSSSVSGRVGSGTSLYPADDVVEGSGETVARSRWTDRESSCRSHIRVLIGLRPEHDRRLRDAAEATGLPAPVVLGRIVRQLAHQMKRWLREDGSFPIYFDEGGSVEADESTRIMRRFVLRSDEDSDLRKGAAVLGLSPYALVAHRVARLHICPSDVLGAGCDRLKALEAYHHLLHTLHTP